MKTRHVIAIAVILLAGMFCLDFVDAWRCPRGSQLQVESKRLLGSVYGILKDAGGWGAPRLHAAPSASDSGPIEAAQLGLTQVYCPSTEYLTGGRVRAPMLLVFAIRKRGSSKWERPGLNSSPVVPLAFYSDSPRELGGPSKGWIGYSDGSVYLGSLPLVSRPIRYYGDHGHEVVEIEFQQDDTRFPYATKIDAIRAQYLGDKD